MEGQPVGLVERRSALLAAREALVGLDEVVFEASGDGLGELMSLVDEVAARAGAARVAVTVEAVSRGEVAAAGVNATAWVREHARSLRQGGAHQVAMVATAVAGPSSVWRPEGGGVDPQSPLGVVWDGVRGGVVSPSLAVAALKEVDRLTPKVNPDALPAVTRGLLELGVAWGVTQMRRLRPRLLAQFGQDGALDELHERLAGAARLSSPLVESADLTQYELLVTPEQAAVLEAAIGPLSAPAPNEVTGARDLRPAGQRRVEALAEVCRRSSALDAEATGGADGAAGSAAAVHVSIALGDLQDRTGAGQVLGSTAAGVVLPPEVLRRVACDAALIPHVLGTQGEVLDLGRVVRLFTRAQRRGLWHRDGQCTFPGCHAPAAWARAHHVRHWADMGLTDLSNAALLCQQHHTFVHTRRLWATVRATPDEQGRCVIWDLHEGSYDRHLQRLRAQEAAADPPALTPARLAELVAALGDPDPVERRCAMAEHDLALHEAELVMLDAELGVHRGTDPWWHDQPWADDYQAELERHDQPRVLTA